MNPITPQQFLIRQPAFPDRKPSDKFYLDLANRLLKECVSAGLFPTLHESVLSRLAICVTGYYQDILSDAGLWRAFTTQCRRMYGHPVPFHSEPEGYIDAELNRIDIAFLIWYCIAMIDSDHRDLYPLHPDVISLSKLWHGILDAEYDEAPMPEEYNIGFQLEVHNPEDASGLYRFSHWLFLHSYLLTPAFTLNLAQLAAEARISEEGGESRLNDLLEEAMSLQPTGPLALYLKEWIYLVLHDRLPDEKDAEEGKTSKEVHKYYKAVTEATGGSPIAYFSDYRELNKFFITALGWQEGEDHLPQFKSHSDFVIQVDPEKGMLLARNVAKCIADPANPLYNAAYARRHAFDLLSVRGLCPPDLLQTILKNGWLPDAAFPDTDDRALVAENADFIARCYLQMFYRGD